MTTMGQNNSRESWPTKLVNFFFFGRELEPTRESFTLHILPGCPLWRTPWTIAGLRRMGNPTSQRIVIRGYETKGDGGGYFIGGDKFYYYGEFGANPVVLDKPKPKRRKRR